MPPSTASGCPGTCSCSPTKHAPAREKPRGRPEKGLANLWSGYTSLHAFAGGADDGANPGGDLTLSGTNFYGMTSQGGAAGLGVVFKMNTDGSSYTNLHSFAGGTGDGATPLGSLTLANGWLYGMTSVGGASNKGTVFRLSTDGRSR